MSDDKIEQKKNFYQKVEEICAKDKRYKPDAYEFLLKGLTFTQSRLDRNGHVSGVELSEGLRELAIEQYGPLAKTVLEYWGINKTLDFGNIVFNLIGEGLFSKTEDDSLDDFKNAYDFKAVFGNKLWDKVVRGIK